MEKPVYDITNRDGMSEYMMWCLRKAKHLKKTAPAKDLKNPEAFWDFVTQEEVPLTQVGVARYDDEDSEFQLIGNIALAESLFKQVAAEVLKK